MTDDNIVQITVIVPVYNVAKYLCHCIDSLLCQSYQNIEIILVDDGSTDSSGKICDEYAAQDSRVKVIHKENGGQGSARNMALDIAKGEYIMFVDSDDWVEPDFCETALCTAIKQDADIVCFGYNMVNREGEIYHQMFTKSPRIISPSEGILELIVRSDVIYSLPWNKIYHKSTIKDIRFPKDVKIYEDQGFVYLAFHNAYTIYVSDVILYNYLQRSNSSSADWDKPEALRCRFKVWSDRLQFIKKHYPELIDTQIKQLAQESFKGIRLLDSNQEDNSDTIKGMKAFLKDNKNIIRNVLPGKKTFLYYYCHPLFSFYNKLH